MSRNPRYPRENRRPPALPEPNRPRRGTALWDIITATFLIASVLVIGTTLLILNDPEASFNPFPNPTLPKVLQIPSPTPVTPSATPTITPTRPTNTPFPTFTPSPTFTESPTPTTTPTQVIQGAGGTGPTLTLSSEGPIGDSTIQPGVVLATQIQSDFPFITRGITYQESPQGCQWIGVAGNVTGINGEPLTDLAIEVVGADFEMIVFTGSNQAFGLAGYEVQVDNILRVEEYSVRLLGPTGLPISDFIDFDTGNTCDRNVAIVDFVQLTPY